MSDVRSPAKAETQRRDSEWKVMEQAPGKASWRRASKLSQDILSRKGRWKEMHGGDIQSKRQSSFLRWQLPGTPGWTDPTSFILELWIWGNMVAELEDLESTKLPSWASC